MSRSCARSCKRCSPSASHSAMLTRARRPKARRRPRARRPRARWKTMRRSWRRRRSRPRRCSICTAGCARRSSSRQALRRSSSGGLRSVWISPQVWRTRRAAAPASRCAVWRRSPRIARQRLPRQSRGPHTRPSTLRSRTRRKRTTRTRTRTRRRTTCPPRRQLP